MPVMDGYTATREIRRNPALQALPIIAMTADAMAGDREKVMAAGMNDHIAKPLNVEQMFATLARWISPRAVAAVAAPPAPPAAGDALPPLAGIDTAAGLATSMGNARLYRRLLGKFRDSQRDFAALFAAALREADPMAAARCAHTLRGTAGNIGANAVQAAAGQLEQACKDGAPAAQRQALLDATLAALVPVIAALDGLAGEPATAGADVVLDMDKVRPLLERLALQLADLDTEATDTVLELQTLTRGTALAAGVDKIAAAVSNYAFEDAEAALRGLDTTA